MDKQMLIRYLEDVVELEKQVFLQQKTLDALDSKIRSLGRSASISQPVYYEQKMDGDKKAAWAVGVGIAVFVLMTIIYYSATNGACTGEELFCGSCKTITLSSIAASVITLIIIKIIMKYKSQSRYDKDEFAYNQKRYSDNQRVNRELAEKRILEQERSALYQKHLQTKQVLQRYYDLNIIYGKYRNFVAVSSFVDYFKSGRCSTLAENTGGDGAYNTFETEVRLDRIVDRLDVVISKLSQIQSNQWCIYNAIQEGNRISSRLVSATERLAESSAQIALSSAQTAHYAGITAANSAIAAYNSQQAANEAEHLRKLKQYELGIRGRRY